MGASLESSVCRNQQKNASFRKPHCTGPFTSTKKPMLRCFKRRENSVRNRARPPPPHDVLYGLAQVGIIVEWAAGIVLVQNHLVQCVNRPRDVYLCVMSLGIPPPLDNLHQSQHRCSPRRKQAVLHLNVHLKKNPSKYGHFQINSAAYVAIVSF